jgi:hypothetical protein
MGQRRLREEQQRRSQTQALPITPPQDAGDVFITWQGTSEYPDLDNFPAPDDRVGISDQGWNDVMLEL